MTHERLEAIATASRVEAIAIRLEAIASRLEAIAIGFHLQSHSQDVRDGSAEKTAQTMVHLHQFGYKSVSKHRTSRKGITWVSNLGVQGQSSDDKIVPARKQQPMKRPVHVF